MAVLKIKVVSIIGRMTDLNKVTEVCGRSSIFHPDNSLSFYSNTSDFVPLNEENPYSDPLQKLTDAVAVSGGKLEMLGTKEADLFRSRVNEDDVRSYVKHISSTLNGLQDKRTQALQKIQSYTAKIDEITHFVGLDWI